jgi:Malic enzyme, NAD binding domain/ACT domain
VALTPSASYSLTVRAAIKNRPGMLGRVTSAIGEAGGDIRAVDLVELVKDVIVRDLTINARDEQHGQEIVMAIRRVDGVRIVNVSDRTFLVHLGGKIAIRNKNPVPEIMPEKAAPHVRVMATGRSDYPNQINNVLAFPGIFRGALDAGAPRITEEMKLAAAQGIADVVAEEDLSEDYIIPSVFDRDVAPAVAKAVVEEARRDGIARVSEETGTFSTIE